MTTDLITLARNKGFKKGAKCKVLGDPFRFRTMTRNKLRQDGDNLWADGTSPFLIIRNGVFVAEICKTSHN